MFKSREGHGYFYVQDFKQIMMHLGERMTDEEFEEYLREGNFERNGKIRIGLRLLDYYTYM